MEGGPAAALYTSPLARVDYDRQAAVFDEARSLGPGDYTSWRLAMLRHIPPGGRVLDLGSGTGRWSALLAEWYGVRVVAVEPSRGMRERAAAKPHGAVALVGGRAERLPLAEDSVDAAFVAHVLHHLDNISATASELRRAVREGGSVLIRQAFGDRLDGISLFRFFPSRIAETFPTAGEIIDVFTAAGFTHTTLERHTQRTGPSLAELIPRIRLRADTTLELLSDEEFERGLKLLEETARVEHGPVLDSLDLLILR